MKSIKNKHILQDISGQNYAIEYTVFHGQDKNAPSIYMQANMHGAEFQGNAVISILIDYFNKYPPKGTITLVPFANPIAINTKNGENNQGRFDPVTGENWNRHYFFDENEISKFMLNHNNTKDKNFCAENFKDYIIQCINDRLSKKTCLSRAQKICYTLQSLAFKSDFVLDLHTGSIAPNYLYMPDEYKDDAKFLDQKYCIVIPSDKFAGAMDEAITIPWNILNKKYNIQHKAYGMTVELCSQEVINFNIASQQAEGILNYLGYIGAIDKDYICHEDHIFCPLDQYQTYYAPYGGLYEWHINTGEFIKCGQKIATCLTKNHRIDITAECDGYLIIRFASAGACEGSELYKFFAISKQN